MKKIQRFDKYMIYKGLNDNRVTKELGLSVGTLGKSRKEGRDLSTKTIEQILNFYTDLSRVWLLTGEGNMLLDEQPRAVISYTEGVPYYDEDFLLGFDELCAPSHEGADFLVRMPGYEKATLWCNATGHSMEPEINSGDVVALQRVEDFSFLPFGDIYGIITTNGMRTIKRLGRSALPGHYLLIPTNPAYDAQDIPTDKIAYVYRVLGALKHF